MIHSALAAAVILGAAAAAQALTSKTLLADRQEQVQYASLVPEKFGEWTLVPQIRLVTPVDSDDLANIIYSQMVGRAYTNKAGQFVMLLVAYGPKQSDRLQLHRPEICYVAEGFRVTSSQPAQIAIEDGAAPLRVRKLIAQREGRVERITYWMRIGDDVVSTLLARQFTKLRYGLQGVIPDGVLVRVSTINLDAEVSEQVQTQFLRDLMKSMAGRDLKYFVGAEKIRNVSAAAAGNAS